MTDKAAIGRRNNAVGPGKAFDCWSSFPPHLLWSLWCDVCSVNRCTISFSLHRVINDPRNYHHVCNWHLNTSERTCGRLHHLHLGDSSDTVPGTSGPPNSWTKVQKNQNNVARQTNDKTHHPPSNSSIQPCYPLHESIVVFLKKIFFKVLQVCKDDVFSSLSRTSIHLTIEKSAEN